MPAAHAATWNHIAPLKAKIAKLEAQLLNEERTFEYVAERWLAFKSAELVTKSISGFSGALNNHILPAIGNTPVSEIKLEHITTIITELRRQRIMAMAMARRVRTIIRAVLGFAEGRGWVFVSPVYPGRPINPTSMLKSFKRIWPEYDITAHDYDDPVLVLDPHAPSLKRTFEAVNGALLCSQSDLGSWGGASVDSAR